MATTEERPVITRIELLTLLLLGLIVTAVVIPKLRSTPAHNAPPAQNAPKQPAALP